MSNFKVYIEEKYDTRADVDIEYNVTLSDGDSIIIIDETFYHEIDATDTAEALCKEYGVDDYEWI